MKQTWTLKYYTRIVSKYKSLPFIFLTSPIKYFYTFALPKNGEVSEWPNEQAWKVWILARVSRVRIPPSPHKTSNKTIKGFACPLRIIYFYPASLFIFKFAKPNFLKCKCRSEERRVGKECRSRW